MFDEDMEEKKAGIIGTVIIGGAGALLGALGVVGFGKGKQLWEDHKAKKEAESPTETAK